MDAVERAVPVMKAMGAKIINASKMAAHRTVKRNNAAMTAAVVYVVNVHPVRSAKIANAKTLLAVSILP
ncbi:MAG: hypothetical protein J6A01_10395 [Proteobacteria bacterium]|nr:hypothetical protein [Pseudomonadota bacterium]